jgi:thiosulfate/3-mercaptopyruvate sulfurtransferase
MSPLISRDELSAHLTDEPSSMMVIDCSFDLAIPSAGWRAFQLGHIPGAAYMHLEDDLSAPRTGLNGRHPLPALADFENAMRARGASNDTLIVVYDNVDGRYAARLWWTLRWAGHAAVRVLDGGWRQWRESGLPFETGEPGDRAPGSFTARASLERVMEYEDIRANLETPKALLLDARARDRFLGRNETLDPVAGHIPGAKNRPYRDNLKDDGRFRDASALRNEFERLLEGRQPEDLIHQCGSGVTSCHNRLAMELAGLSGSAMYVGSWSEWCAKPGSPIAIGDDQRCGDRWVPRNPANLDAKR